MQQFLPIVSFMQDPKGEVSSVEPIFPQGREDLGHLQAEFTWRHYSICRFHQALFFELKRWNQANDVLYEQLKTSFENPTRELEVMAYVRSREYIRGNDWEIDWVKQLADEYTVVALWALVE